MVTVPHETSLNETPFYPVALMFFTIIRMQEREHLLILSLRRNFISEAIAKSEVEIYAFNSHSLQKYETNNSKDISVAKHVQKLHIYILFIEKCK